MYVQAGDGVQTLCRELVRETNLVNLVREIKSMATHSARQPLLPPDSGNLRGHGSQLYLGK